MTASGATAARQLFVPIPAGRFSGVWRRSIAREPGKVVDPGLSAFGWRRQTTVVDRQPMLPDHTCMFSVALAFVVASVSEPRRRPWATDPQIRSIVSRCRVPAAWLTRRPDGSTHFRPPVAARYKDVDCVVRRLRALHVGPIAYIGNEKGY